MMGVLSWIVLGLAAGLLAGHLTMGGGYSLIGDNILVGILGAVVAGFLSSSLLGIDINGFNFTSGVIAVLGACLLIGVSRALGEREARA